jgi:hypothetical protein
MMKIKLITTKDLWYWANVGMFAVVQEIKKPAFMQPKIPLLFSQKPASGL